jgi:phosphatidylinositol phospholipase C epsilon
LFTGLLTRNSSFELEEWRDNSAIEKKKIYDAIAAASIMSNSAGVDTSRSQVITLNNFSKFLETKQCERLVEAEVIELIHVSVGIGE